MRLTGLMACIRYLGCAWVAFFSLFLFSVSVWGSPPSFERGVKAYQAEDYSTARKHWQFLALYGHASAQYNLGVMHRNGLGVPQDNRLALKWFRVAAQQRHAYAQVSLGAMYKEGAGVKQNYRTAIYWFHLASVQGHRAAQYYLGTMYSDGLGVRRDDRRAAQAFLMAAARNHVFAQYKLGALYAAGRGIAQNNVYAYMWWDIAAKSGLHAAAFARNTLAKQMQSRHIEYAKDLALLCASKNYRGCARSGGEMVGLPF